MKLTSRMSWGLMLVLSVGVALISYRYFAGVGPRPESILGNAFAKPWLYIHIGGAATALLVGGFQFLPGVRCRAPLVHRWLGRVYVVGCLVGGAGGLVAAFGSTAGPIATVGFASLAVAWIVTNVQGWRLALSRRFGEHREWMIRSFALTLAAVTLRIYLPLIPVMGVPFLEGYRAISFLCWLPNLILAELYIRGAFSQRMAASAA